MIGRISSAMVVIALLVTLSYASTIYIFSSIQSGFDKLSALNAQANRTTQLRAETLVYIQGPTPLLLQHLQNTYQIWLANNQLTEYPNDVQKEIALKDGPASAIEQYEVQMFTKPDQSVYVQYVTFIGAYNLVINTATILLLQYLNAKIVILYFTLTAIYLVNIIAVVVEYIYVRQPAKNAVRAGDTLNRRITSILEAHTERPPPDSPGSSD